MKEKGQKLQNVTKDQELLDRTYNHLILIKSLMKKHPMTAAKEEVSNLISYMEQEWQRRDEEDYGAD